MAQRVGEPIAYNLGMLTPGSVAPDFAVADETGTTRRLADYRGKIVVLWFYPKADTPG